jgi:hypothetical protein
MCECVYLTKGRGKPEGISFGGSPFYFSLVWVRRIEYVTGSSLPKCWEVPFREVGVFFLKLKKIVSSINFLTSVLDVVFPVGCRHDQLISQSLDAIILNVDNRVKVMVRRILWISKCILVLLICQRHMPPVQLYCSFDMEYSHVLEPTNNVHKTVLVR